MTREFHINNRNNLAASMSDGSAAVFFSGHAKRRTADENFAFYADRDFLYLTGLKNEGLILLLYKLNGELTQKLYLLPPDMIKERWTGKRVKENEAADISGIADFAYTDIFICELDALINSGVREIYIDFDPHGKSEPDLCANVFAADIKTRCSKVIISDIHPAVAALRSIKTPEEITAIKRAEEITGAGITALMRSVKDGMYEYELKALYDYELAKHGVDTAAFPPIISAGANNFCIHYYSYTGIARDKDMVLNDVGASFDNHGTDVSRAYPVNGKFNDRQKLLFECAYKTSEHTFSMIKPGLPMRFADNENRSYCAKLLCETGLLDKPENVGKYMWHAGAHHVGYDTHDDVGNIEIMKPGMVFCIDVGIYVEEWGIGFRLEDNCLVTENGSCNLSAAIPRTVSDIEEVMN